MTTFLNTWTSGDDDDDDDRGVVVRSCVVVGLRVVIDFITLESVLRGPTVYVRARRLSLNQALN